jgi:hypothetical protein
MSSGTEPTLRARGGRVTTRQAAVRWVSSPHGEPSGVCTGHMKPQDSGSSLRTAVVRSCAKYAPLCTERKCDRYLQGRHTEDGSLICKHLLSVGNSKQMVLRPKRGGLATQTKTVGALLLYILCQSVT